MANGELLLGTPPSPGVLTSIDAEGLSGVLPSLGEDTARLAEVLTGSAVSLGVITAELGRQDAGTPPSEGKGTARFGASSTIIIPTPQPCICPDPTNITVIVGQAGSGGTLSCWDGTGQTPLEVALGMPITNYANLDALRRYLLQALVINPSYLSFSPRVMIQTSFATEVYVIPSSYYTPSDALLASNVCEKQPYAVVDTLMASKAYLLRPALDELLFITTIPSEYVDLIVNQTDAVQPINRVAAAAAIVVTAVAVLTA